MQFLNFSRFSQCGISGTGDESIKTLIAQSVPRCLYRNIHENNLRQNIETNSNYLRFQQSRTHPHKNETSWKRTQYCNDEIVEEPIPTYLLNNIIADDTALNEKLYLNFKQPLSNAIIGCYHDGKELLLHSGGKNCSDIVLRHARDCVTMSNTQSAKVRGFTLHIEGEGKIFDFMQLSGSSYDISSHIFVRRDCELFHIKTSDLQDYSNDSIILEPREQYKFPINIESTSNCYSGAQMNILLSDGSLKRWNPYYGLKSYSDKPIVDISPNQYISRLLSRKVQLYSSSHPQLLYLSKDDKFFIKDLRCNSKISELFQLPNGTIASAVQSTLSNNSTEQYIFISKDDDNPSLLCIDQRYPKYSLCERFVPQAHTTMKIFENKNYNCVYGSSCKSSQIFCHSINSIYESFGNDSLKSKKHIMSCYSASVLNDISDWKTTGFPVVDQNTNVKLDGFELIPLQDKTYSNDNDSSEFLSLLVQQNDIGDVYCQILCHSKTKNTSPQYLLPVGNVLSEEEISQPARDSTSGTTKSICTIDNFLESPDKNASLFPLNSSSFMPFINEESLKNRFSHLIVTPLEVKLDETEYTTKTQSNITIEDILEIISPNLPQSLWSCWKVLCDERKEILDINVILKSLRKRNDLVEYSLNLSFKSFDGIFMQPDDMSSLDVKKCNCDQFISSKSSVCSTECIIAHSIIFNNKLSLKESNMNSNFQKYKSRLLRAWDEV